MSFGCVAGPDHVLDFRRSINQSTLAATRDLKEWIAVDGPALESARSLLADWEQQEASTALLPLTSVRLRAPISNPGKIVAIGLNYRDHAEEQGAPLPESPLIFAKFPSAVIGPGDSIHLPEISAKVDPEAELCIVPLDRGIRWDRTTIRSRVAFMIGNDVSARDLQFSDKQWVRGKSCDTFAPCGPWLVTADEVGDPHSLTIELRVNGELRQSSSTSQLIFDTEDLVEHISETVTLEPGDIIFSGTPSGVGVFRDPPLFLQPGDEVEVFIEKLGSLRNRVI